MATARISKRRVDALKPRKSVYDVRDRDLKGFGIRVLPSGAKRYFVQSQHRGQRVWKIVGDSGAVGIDEARNRARNLRAAIRNGTGDEAAAPPEIAFETVADEVFRRYARNWKPSTLKVNRNYYRNHILPWFEGRPIAGITTHDVRRWFGSLHNTPVSADRSAPILSVIMRQAEVYGYRPEGTNPCAGIKRYRRLGRERFLSAAEIGRPGGVLARYEADHPQAVAIIRLLLLTGCRKGEIITLKWRFYRERKLFLPDSKSVPRTVWLSSAARHPRRPAPQNNLDLPLSQDGRLSEPSGGRPSLESRDSRSESVRSPPAHFRHRFATHAVLQGVPLPVVSRLLGHKQPSMTMRYAHVGDREIEAAAERVGTAIAQTLADTVNSSDRQPRANNRTIALRMEDDCAPSGATVLANRPGSKRQSCRA